MTAEIAIMNKSAVALAADSAVTITQGNNQHKIFDSADKLFELSRHDPIGIMIYNGMSFAEIPLSALIGRFRSESDGAATVPAAADEFLKFLDKVGRDAPTEVHARTIDRIVRPVIDDVRKRFENQFQTRIAKEGFSDVQEFIRKLLAEALSIYEYIYGQRDEAKFLGEGEIEFEPWAETVIDYAIGKLPDEDPNIRSRFRDLAKLAVRKVGPSSGFTGIVIAGFGSKELFPSLVSYQVDGTVCGRLKYAQAEQVDIDRKGSKAKVIPFAQKEMVERFLYGLDADIERQITTFCTQAITQIRERYVESFDFEEDADKSEADQVGREAETAFLDGLRTKAFERIREASRQEIEDMVEFMPKPELAKMAEALINLTSIKRRVTRGMETVGGPIDVALISQTDGFVWVKRKHYFTGELNPRYFERIRRMASLERKDHGLGTEGARSNTAPRRKKNNKDG